MNEQTTNPRLLAYLKRQNNTGKIVLFTAWFLSVGSLFVLGDNVLSAVTALCIAGTGWFAGGYYISRSFLVVKRPGIYRIALSLLFVAGALWFWHRVWVNEFGTRDYDFGTLKIILSLPFIFFFPLLDGLIRYNYRTGVYRRISERFQ